MIVVHIFEDKAELCQCFNTLRKASTKRFNLSNSTIVSLTETHRFYTKDQLEKDYLRGCVIDRVIFHCNIDRDLAMSVLAPALFYADEKYRKEFFNQLP